MTKDEAKAAVEMRIFNGVQFTFNQLSMHCRGVDGMRDPWRIADAAIQRNRKKGFIAFIRNGNQSIWHLTDAGKAEAAHRAAKSS